jgi:hypothetical protein
MKFSFKWTRILLALAVLAIVLHGCGGGGSPSSPGAPTHDPDSIHLTFGDLSGDPVAGYEVSIPVLVTNASELYAFSFRIEFDPAGAQPVDVDWGSFKGETDVVFNPLDKPGLLPLAYSRLDGFGFEGDGTVCELKFRVIDPARFNLKIVSAPEYLVGYNLSHERLNLTAGGEV